MPYAPGGSALSQAPATANYSGLTIPQLEAIFQTPTSAITDIGNNWLKLAGQIRDKILGQDVNYAGGVDPLADGISGDPHQARKALTKLSTNDRACFDGILLTLKDWQSPAADEFISKALQVRTFGMNIVQRCYQLAEAGGSMYGYTFHETLNSMSQDLSDAEQVYSATHDGRDLSTSNPDPNQGSGLRFGRGRIAQNVWDLLNQKQLWSGGFLQSAQLSNGLHSFADGTQASIRGNFDQGDGITEGGHMTDYSFVYWPNKFYINTPYKISGAVALADPVNGGNSTVTLYRESAPPISQVFNLSSISTDDIMAFYADDYRRQLSDLLTDFAVTYVTAKDQLPDTPTAPKGIGQSGTASGTRGPGTGSGPFAAGSGLGPFGPGSGTGGLSPFSDPGSLGVGGNGSVPGFGAGSSNGGVSLPGTSNAGAGFDPTQLAGFNPGGGLTPGAGFGAGGAGGLGRSLGPGGLGLGGSGDGAFPGGTALGGADGLGAGAGLPGAEGGLAAGAGAAGTAGRGMPMMPPMAGAGAGKDRGERQRAAWLTEDDDVWGASDDGGDAVL